MKRFEYKTELIAGDTNVELAVEKFNQFGLEGWRIIYVTPGSLLTEPLQLVRVWLMREIIS